jgi:3-oxoacyl-[acyl-carrier protein] reductase
MRLFDKVAVVTGGTKGLGKAIAQEYADEGATVICAARSVPDSDAPKSEGGSMHVRRVDVTDQLSVRALLDDVASEFGALDVLVSNAGVNVDGKVAALPSESWDEMLATNLTGTFNCIQAAVPHMDKQGGGRIITVSSSMATRVAVGAAGYCSTKAAVEMLTRVSAIELGRKKIVVNCLSPGILDDGMGKELVDNEKVWQAYRPRFALDRPGTVAEAARAAVFLASEDSSYVNGAVLEVNGGLLWA